MEYCSHLIVWLDHTSEHKAIRSREKPAALLWRAGRRPPGNGILAGSPIALQRNVPEELSHFDVDKLCLAVAGFQKHIALGVRVDPMR